MPNISIWGQLEDTFKRLDHLSHATDEDSFDDKERFEAAWSKRRFTYLNPGRAAGKDTANVLYRRLFVQWDTLDDEQRRLLLNASPSTEPKIVLALEAAAENAYWVQENRSDIGYGFDLRGLQNSSEQFALQNVSLYEYEYAKTLTTDDWYALRAKISDLLSQHAIWWSRGKAFAVRPPGVSDFIDGAFDGDPTAETYWDALVLSLDAARPADTLLAVEVALSRILIRAKSAWRKRADQVGSEAVEEDKRVPTFIVVDEAHNFAPERSSDPLRSRVTSRLMQIASEGRKYGIYLMLATQRPTKLHSELVPECENSCVLRMQSELEVEFARRVLGIPEAVAGSIPGFTQGQGLFVGRWVNSPPPLDTRIAPARTVVGGGGVGDDWRNSPVGTPPVASVEDSVSKFVKSTIESLPSPITLVSLAPMITEEFDQVRSGDWLGRGSLKNLLLSLKIDDLRLATDIPPGYAYLEGVHSPPEASLTFSQTELQNMEPDARNAVLLAHDVIGLPLLNKATFGTILQTISNEVQFTEFNLTDVSKVVRDECHHHGIVVPRRAISFVIKGINRSGHRYDPDLPQTPVVLAEAFVQSVLQSLQRSGGDIDPAIEEILRRHISGGLLEVVLDQPSVNDS